MRQNKTRWLKMSAKTKVAVGKAAVDACWVDSKDYCDKGGNVDYARIGKIFANYGYVFAEERGSVYLVPIWDFADFKKEFPDCTLGDSEFLYCTDWGFDCYIQQYGWETIIYDASRAIPGYNGPYNPCYVCSDFSTDEYMSAEMEALISALNAIEIADEKG